ncbi:MAG: hypothetical protein IJ036_00345 [Lachnospiraceae bacterium]|nr:hypothetical protein [Lachnospiraceae bacterium]
MSRVEDFLSNTKLNELLCKKEAEEKSKNTLLWILAIVGAVAAVALIAYGVYRYFAPDYLDDLDEECDEDFEDDFFDEEEV